MSVQLTDDGREVLRTAGLGVAVTVAATTLGLVALGVAAAVGALTLVRLLIVVVFFGGPAMGAAVAARANVRSMGYGAMAIMVGGVGPLALVVVFGVASLVEGGTAVVPTVVAPLLGIVCGAAVGGLVGRPARQ